MERLIELQEKRGELIESLDNILENADSDKRDLTDEENKEYKSLEADLEKVEEKIDMVKKQNERKAKLAKEEEVRKAEQESAKKAAQAAGGEAPADEPKMDSEETDILKLSAKYNLAKAIRMLTGAEEKGGVEEELSQEARKEAHTGGANFGYKGMAIPAKVLRAEWKKAEKRTDIDQTNSGIQPTVVGAYVESIRQNAVFSQVIPSGNILEGLTGDFKIPSVGSQSVAWATAENSAAADGGANFGKDTLAPIRLTGFADISNRVLLQNGDQAMSIVMEDFGREVANKIDAALFSTANITNAIPSIAATSGVNTFTEAATYAAPSSTVNGSVYDDYLAALQELANNDTAKGALAFVGHTKLMSDLLKSPRVISTTPAAQDLMTGAPLAVSLNGVPFYLTTSNTSDGSTSADFIGGDFNFQYLGFFGGIDMTVDPYSSLLNDQQRIVIHRHLDASTIRGGAFVKSTTLLS